uniref:DNA-directed RNA polymerase subunit beta' n=1 Tax=Tupiella akineta TaxID=160070 RepID=RPOC1_TUPAK|nr:beta' subunit of RNA polymerase [Tupiella akineta]Q3ZJ92.1 RecName: Full=DNA-directed RNA polymerase subunit beta'; AltName: Full=PEP; AltName: Full=Plastid-encoded RNA polymerase subunit beta'; Short=RNA polymerase subunit beta' [Tupiella akineta]AAV80599.1 beta' subunit of RNA polymerase [Tupiella akineta]
MSSDLKYSLSSEPPQPQVQSPLLKILKGEVSETTELKKLHSFRLCLSSPKIIKQWAQRTLPNGEIVGSITNAQTVNYKTLKPEKGGLFCERVFGPVKDFYCSCGKQKTKQHPKVCPTCGVQYISSQSRRYKMGYIELVSPVTHIWYLKSSPSYISLLLNLKKKNLEALTYCSENLSLNIKSFQNELLFQNVLHLLKANPFALEKGLKKRKKRFLVNSNWFSFIFDNSYLIKANSGFQLKVKDFPFFLITKNQNLQNFMGVCSQSANGNEQILPEMEKQGKNTFQFSPFLTTVQKHGSSENGSFPELKREKDELELFKLIDSFSSKSPSKKKDFFRSEILTAFYKKYSKFHFSRFRSNKKSFLISLFSSSNNWYFNKNQNIGYFSIFNKNFKIFFSLLNYQILLKTIDKNSLANLLSPLFDNYLNDDSQVLFDDSIKKLNLTKNFRSNEDQELSTLLNSCFFLNKIGAIAQSPFSLAFYTQKSEKFYCFSPSFLNPFEKDSLSGKIFSLKKKKILPSQKMFELKPLTLFCSKKTKRNEVESENPNSNHMLPFIAFSKKQRCEEKADFFKQLRMIELESEKSRSPKDLLFLNKFPFKNEKKLKYNLQKRNKLHTLKNPIGNFKFRKYFSLRLDSSLKRSLLIYQIKNFKNGFEHSDFYSENQTSTNFTKFLVSRELEKSSKFSNSLFSFENFAQLLIFIFDFPAALERQRQSFSLRSYSKSANFRSQTSARGEVGGNFNLEVKQSQNYFLDWKLTNNYRNFYQSSEIQNLNCFFISNFLVKNAIPVSPLSLEQFVFNNETQKNLHLGNEDSRFFANLKKPIKKLGLLKNSFLAETLANAKANAHNLKENRTPVIQDKENESQTFSQLFFDQIDQKEGSSLKSKDLNFTNWNNKKITRFIELLEKTLFLKKPGLVNNYYTISQSLQWPCQKDWARFLNYMTNTADKTDSLIPSYLERGISFDLVLTGAGSIKKLLSLFTPMGKKASIEIVAKQINGTLLKLNRDIKRLEDFFKFEIFFIDDQEIIEKVFMKLVILRSLRSKALRRLKVLRPFKGSHVLPEWMVLSVLPILPPALRPIIPLDSQQVAVSDLNKLYQTVLFRNKRVQRFYNDYYSLNFSEEMRYAQRLLQEAVDALIENGKGDSAAITASNNRPLKSLSDMIKGKKGRFRQNLLGKRVDYSGRSVIVVGPKLRLHECGLPKEMAIELFQPFLIRRLIFKEVATNFISAKKLIKSNPESILDILREVMENRPVLLNRAPTLHRLGIQAFQPKLISGRAILLHPLVCAAFNADFDGDQMAVHIPLSFQACAEAWKLMGSRNNLLSPATGEPIILPSQDMVLGCYYLTTLDRVKIKQKLSQSSFLFPFLISKQGVHENLSTISSNSKGIENWILKKPSQKSEIRTLSSFYEINESERATFESKTNDTSILKLQDKKRRETLTFKRNRLSPVDTKLHLMDLSKNKNQNLFLNRFEKRANCKVWSDSNKYYSNWDQVLQSLNQQLIDLHSPIWLRWNFYFEFVLKKESFLEIRLDKYGNSVYINPNYQSYSNSKLEKIVFYIRTTPGRVLMNKLIFEALNKPSLKKSF